MRVLGIDYGTKRIGLAVTDSAHIAAHPLKVLENKGVKHFVEEIAGMIQPEEIEAVVVGRPLGMQGKLSDFTKVVDEVTKRLREALPVPVSQIDERLTSKSSERIHDGSGKSKVDTRSAQLILETYLALEKR